MVVLYAFTESWPFDDEHDFFVAGWFPVAKLESLRNLSKEEFQYFCKFYGKSNLRLRCEI